MNNHQYIKYLFDNVKKISLANPGVIRDTYGNGENLTHKFFNATFGAQRRNRQNPVRCCRLAYQSWPSLSSLGEGCPYPN